MRGFVKNAFFLVFSRAPLGTRASILSYHNVGNDGAHFTVSPSAFRRQIKYIVAHGFHVISLIELIGRLEKGEDISRCVALTFNDGYKSLYTDVFPILQEFKLPATVFVTAEFLDTNIQTTEGYTYQTIAVNELREMHESGLVTFMPQTQQTIRLSSVVFESAVAAIERARADIEAVIKEDAPIFAYPKGAYTEEVVQYLHNHNWRGAVTLCEGLVTAKTNVFELPRNLVDSTTSFVQFAGKLSGAIDQYMYFRGMK